MTAACSGRLNVSRLDGLICHQRRFGKSDEDGVPGSETLQQKENVFFTFLTRSSSEFHGEAQ